MERANRWVVGAFAIALWITTAAAAMAGLNLKVYLLFWLGAGVTSLWALVEVWLARPDHGGLAKVRGQLYAARLNGALMEEDNLRIAEARQPRRYMNHVG